MWKYYENYNMCILWLRILFHILIYKDLKKVSSKKWQRMAVWNIWPYIRVLSLNIVIFDLQFTSIFVDCVVSIKFYLTVNYNSVIPD